MFTLFFIQFLAKFTSVKISTGIILDIMFLIFFSNFYEIFFLTDRILKYSKNLKHA